ncbi:hypothetical protein C1645_825587 [Glomus cerebriforme]|uniref:Uncharacterized protein n=1 Tax=Glomus cerebriforme TaxID=658196 RepID=A0A397T1J0_9GLOM|nr:hypothetical protein C1645_825587 [Glomus cerebriforme]
MLFPVIKSKKGLIALSLQDLHDSLYHALFCQDGKRYDAESSPIIMSDGEPWVHNKKYIRTSAFLDDDKTIQLFIGKTTVQVWYRKSTNSKEQLKYIWVVPNNGTLLVKSLEIGQGEFKVTLFTRYFYEEDDDVSVENIVNIQWPLKVNAINGACSALWHLHYKRNDVTGPQKQQKYENLVCEIEIIVEQLIKKRPDIWRLIDIRHNVMASLIYGHRIRLVQQILKKKESDSFIKYLHIPRLYEWPKKNPKQVIWKLQ